MGIGAVMHTKAGHYLKGDGAVWLLLLIMLQITTESFVWSYKSSWAVSSPWASEWGDYYSYWAHHLVTIALLQILVQLVFPAFMQLPLIKNVDLVKITAVALVNTTLLWQIPRLDKYLKPELYTYEFCVNSMQHGFNLFLLAMYIYKSKRPLRHYSFSHTVAVPAAYAAFILYRVCTKQSTMRYYLPEGMGTPHYTAVVGAMWIALQFFSELVVLPLVRSARHAPKLARRAARSLAAFRQRVLRDSDGSWREAFARALQQEELLFLAPLVRRISGKSVELEDEEVVLEERGARAPTAVAAAVGGELLACESTDAAAVADRSVQPL